MSEQYRHEQEAEQQPTTQQQSFLQRCTDRISQTSRTTKVVAVSMLLAVIVIIIIGTSATSVGSTATTAAAAAAATNTTAMMSYTSTSNRTYSLPLGPYYDPAASPLLSNVTNYEPGVPLVLTVTVISGSGLTVSGAKVDFWSADAEGFYSGIASQGTQGEQFLRGYQQTNAMGQVTFTAIIPGGYTSRCPHIHLQITTYSNSSSNNTTVSVNTTDTTQLFFPDAVNVAVQSLSAYVRTATAATTTTPASMTVMTNNSADPLYNSQNQLSMSGTYGGGFVASYTVVLPMIASAASSNSSNSIK